MDIEAWLCFWREGAPVFASLAGSQKGSQRLAKNVISATRWKECKDRGIRCCKVRISTPTSDGASRQQIGQIKSDLADVANGLRTRLCPD